MLSRRSFNTYAICAAVGSLFMLPAPALAESQNWLVGAWKLVSATQTENGQTREYFGPHPLGQVIFDANGQFSDILLTNFMMLRTSSAANLGNRSYLPSAHRNSMTRFLPSTWPKSRSPDRNASSWLA